MIVVGFVSSYAEGRLVRGAIDSLLEADVDRLYVWEGPAGPPLENESELPPSDVDRYLGSPADVVIHRGRWRTDGRKRDHWLQRVKSDYPGELVWAVVVDADEVLVNARYLRDRLEWIVASDELKGADIRDADNPPMARWPLRLVEHEGSMSVITARVFRVDLLRSIDHSTSIVTNVAGVRDGWGNYEDAAAPAWIMGWVAATERGKPVAWPPYPCEPHLVHRSNLRRPDRAHLRMSEQEAEEFRRAQELELAGGLELERGGDVRLH